MLQIRFVDRDGGELGDEFEDIDIQEQVGILNLNDGLFIESWLSDEELQLITSMKDDDPKTVDVIFVGEIVIDSDGDGMTEPSGILGYAIREGSGFSDQFVNTVIISTDRDVFTTPHEVGHILTDRSHYGTDYFGEMIILANLMKEGGSIPDMNGVEVPKRLTLNQCNWSKTETMLPEDDN